MATLEGFWYHTRVQFDHTDAQGRVFYAHYFRLLDQAARRTVLSKWTFVPAMRDGRAVEALGRLPIEFRVE